jgi:hypothetical protein
VSGVTIKASRRNFFDRKGVADAVTKQTADALRLGGGLIRKIMRRSIRSGGTNQTASRPGEPPRTHGKQLLKRLIYFNFVRGGVLKDHSVWVGPVLSNTPTGAPEILEFGGTVHLPKGTPIRVDGRTDKRGRLRGGKFVPGPERTIRIAPRPYLGPALDKAVASGQLPGYWKNATIGGG